MDIRERLKATGHKQVELLEPLAKRLQAPVSPSDVSLALGGRFAQKKHQRIREEADALITEWENQSPRD